MQRYLGKVHYRCVRCVLHGHGWGWAGTLSISLGVTHALSKGKYTDTESTNNKDHVVWAILEDDQHLKSDKPKQRQSLGPSHIIHPVPGGFCWVQLAYTSPVWVSPVLDPWVPFCWWQFLLQLSPSPYAFLPWHCCLVWNRLLEGLCLVSFPLCFWVCGSSISLYSRNQFLPGPPTPSSNHYFITQIIDSLGVSTCI